MKTYHSLPWIIEFIFAVASYVGLIVLIIYLFTVSDDWVDRIFILYGIALFARHQSLYNYRGTFYPTGAKYFKKPGAVVAPITDFYLKPILKRFGRPGTENYSTWETIDATPQLIIFGSLFGFWFIADQIIDKL